MFLQVISIFQPVYLALKLNLSLKLRHPKNKPILLYISYKKKYRVINANS